MTTTTFTPDTTPGTTADAAPTRTPATGRVVLVTGGSRGLGRATALALAAAGDDVVVTYRTGTQECAEVVAAIEGLGRRAVALALDTTAADGYDGFVSALRDALATWGRDTFDVLVNNAGTSGDTPVGATDPAVLDHLYAVHVRSVVLLTQELLPLLADGGRILNVSSGLTQNTFNASYSVYAAMKGAVEVYSRYLARALGGRGIAVNVLAPGATATDFAGGLIRDNDEYQDAISATSAMGRVGRPDDIGRAAAAILAPGNGWVTGQRVEAAGGQGMGPATSRSDSGR